MSTKYKILQRPKHTQKNDIGISNPAVEDEIDPEIVHYMNQLRIGPCVSPFEFPQSPCMTPSFMSPPTPFHFSKSDSPLQVDYIQLQQFIHQQTIQYFGAIAAQQNIQYIPNITPIHYTNLPSTDQKVLTIKTKMPASEFSKFITKTQQEINKINQANVFKANK